MGQGDAKPAKKPCLPGGLHKLDTRKFGREALQELSTVTLGPPVGDPITLYVPPLDYKREGTPLRKEGFFFFLTPRDTQAQAIQHYSGRRVLRSGGPNHSKPRVCSSPCLEVSDLLISPPSP
jgi:hypothetical protein